MHKSLCFCEQIPKIATNTELLLVIHHREARKPTNTGKLAVECLSNSRVVVRGCMGSSDSDFALKAGRQPLLLFPSDEARPLADYAHHEQPLTLIIPDGTWRQAAKVRHRLPGLGEVPLVALPPGPPSRYRLRSESREGGLATMEAIARALGVLEGVAVQSALERVFRIMCERVLWSRGSIDASVVLDGLPKHAERHDPISGVRGEDSTTDGQDGCFASPFEQGNSS